MKTQMVGWFEIPVLDMDRAVKFYNEVFQIEIGIHDLGNVVMGWFPYAEDGKTPGASGSLVLAPDFYKPSKEGTLVYFSSKTDDLNDELSRVVKAGGQVLQQKTQISEDHGYYALVLDTEGNRVALHSSN